MARFTPNPISNIMAGLADLNANLTAVKTAIDRMLSRKPDDGVNTMEVDLDMNSNRVFNLPPPVDLTEAARHGDIQPYVTSAAASAASAAASAVQTSADAAEVRQIASALDVQEVWEPEATAYFVADPDAWNTETQIKFNTALRRTKDEGIWDKLAFFYLFAAPSEIQAKINLKNPGTNTLNTFGGITFEPNKGFKGNRLDAYMSTGYVLGGEGQPGYETLSAGVWVYDGSTEDTRAAMGASTTADNFYIYPQNANGTITARANTQGTTPITAEVDSPMGLTVVIREDASFVSLLKNGVLLKTEAFPIVTGTPVFNSTVQFLRWGSGNYGSYGLSIGFYSLQALEHSEVAALYDIWGDYLKYVGAINAYDVTDPNFTLDPDDTLLVSRDKKIIEVISYRQFRAAIFRGQRNVETLEILDRLEDADVPTAAQLNAMDDTISALKVQGYWDEYIDSFIYLANANPRLSLIDWKVPSRNAIAVNSPVFTVQGGFTASKDTRAYIDTGFAPDEHGERYEPESSFLLVHVFSNDPADAESATIGSSRWSRHEDANVQLATLYRSRARMTARAAAGEISGVMNNQPSGVYLFGSPASTVGTSVFNRDIINGGTVFRAYRNGAVVGPGLGLASTANGYPLGNIFLGYDQTPTVERFANHRFGLFISGGQMGNDKIPGLQTIINNTFTALGSA